MHCRVERKDRECCFLASFLYAWNTGEQRLQLWQDLAALASNIQMPWLCSGDFNIILKCNEKMGGNSPNQKDMDDFQHFVEASSLLELPYKGCYYTWCNQQNQEARIYSKLDRTLGNILWADSNFCLDIEYLMPGISDHSPCLITMVRPHIQGAKPFKFLNAWTTHQEFKTLLSSVWKVNFNGCKMFQVVSKLKSLKNSLKNWNKKIFGDINAAVKSAKQALFLAQRKLVECPMKEAYIQDEKLRRIELMEAISNQNSLLRQKARTTWAHMGDEKIFSCLY
jgi:hypothetical protein